MATQVKSSKSTLQTYFKQINKYPLLTFEDEVDLSKRILDGNKEAKKKLIESNLRLVVMIAKPYISNEMSFSDVIQEGNIGLMKAAEKYDYRKNVRFSTYAVWWIRQSITRAITNKKRPIRIPHKKEETIKKSKEARNSLFQTLMREPTIEEMAKEMRMDVNKLNDIFQISADMISLDAKINNSDNTYISMFEDESFEPAAKLFNKHMRKDTIKSLNILSERERQVLLYRYSFYDGKKHTLQKIGDTLGLSPETVRQVEKRAVNKLKKEAFKLKEYIYTE